LASAIEAATAKAVQKLFSEHPGHYYYLSLITTGDALAPTLAAWSEESLDKAVNYAPDKEKARWFLKWSYADSPFCCFGDEFFEPIRKLFARRPNIHSLNDADYQAEYDLRLDAMEAAMARLDKQGIFGTGQDRLRIVVNVEVMPPDYTNTTRAKRLNPSQAIQTWLEEAAE
jgi:hypothetical protein